MKRIGEGAAKVGDILWTGGRQYFYVHNNVNGRMVMSGISEYGDLFSKNKYYHASYITQTKEERNKFFNLIEKFNKNRGVYR